MHLLPLLLLPLTLATPSLDYTTGGADVGVSSDCTITVYSDARCGHDSKTFRGKYYGVQQSWPSGFRSYKLSRDLRPNEQLDFSTSADSQVAGAQGKNDDRIMDASTPPNSCGVFTKKVLSDGDRRGGACHGVPVSSQCVNLWKSS